MPCWSIKNKLYSSVVSQPTLPHSSFLCGHATRSALRTDTTKGHYNISNFCYPIIVFLCLLSFFFGLPKLVNPASTQEFSVAFVNSLLAYWNGQYYMMLTCEAYGKNLALMR